MAAIALIHIPGKQRAGHAHPGLPVDEAVGSATIRITAAIACGG
jgi:hypothetical protein